MDALTPRWDIVQGAQQIGYAWQTQPFKGNLVTYENGLTGGFTSKIALDRDSYRAVIVLSNTAAQVDSAADGLLVGDLVSPDMAPRKQVVSDFVANNPDVTMDWRALPSNIQWDRVARTTLLSGEQVDLVNINGQFIRAWVRDNLLEDLSQYAQLTPAFANVDASFLAA